MLIIAVLMLGTAALAEGETGNKDKSKYTKYFTFESARVLKGIYPSTDLYFFVPDYWDTDYMYAGLQFSVSDIITDDVPALISVLVNGQPVYSASVRYSDGRDQIMQVDIPVSIINKGYNLLTVEAYIKIYEDFESCSEQFASANWITINKSSYVCAGYSMTEDVTNIGLYPYPYISTVNSTGYGTAVLIPDDFSGNELAAALYLYTDISSETEKRNELFFGTVSKAPKEAEKQIIVAAYNKLPQTYKAYIDKAVKDKAVVKSVWVDKKLTMIITADTDANLMEAVNMLMDTARCTQENGNTAYINEGSAETAKQNMAVSDLTADRYTLKDIMGSGINFTGPFHIEKTVFLPFENDYILSSAGKITLKFRYSENLDFNRSLVTVYWGNVPLASKKLSKENASGDELVVTMSPDVVGSTTKSIKIAFDLEIADLLCSMRKDEMPWAYVSEDTALYLPSQTNIVPSFSYLPSPYQKKGRFSDVLVVTSDAPDALELNILAKAFALYGKGIQAYGSITAIRAADFNKDYYEHNIITAGTYIKNSFIKSLNDSLYYKYKGDGSAFLSNSKLVLSDSYAQSITALQLIKSPYSSGRMILALCCIDTASETLLGDFLTESEDMAKLSGDCVLVDPTLEVRPFKFSEETDKSVKPSLAQFIRENKTSLMFILTAAAVLLLLLSASVIILIRARKNRF
jgi:hypothetical protein